MNFTPVLDELLICQITSAHHENTEFDHCLLPCDGIFILLSTDPMPARRSCGCIFPAPRRASGRVVADPGVSGRHAATSKSAVAGAKAARAIGARAVTIFASVSADSSMKVAPAFSRSGLILRQPVAG